MIKTGFGMSWSLVTPVVYRLLERKWVDRFFETGELLISSFARFSQHPDEQRKDVEGVSNIALHGEQHTVLAKTRFGGDAYILCGTTCPPTEQLLGAFGADAAITILETTAFADVLSKYIPGAGWGYEGYCQYSDGSVHALLDAPKMEQVKKSKDMTDLFNLSKDAVGAAPLFRKSARFNHQFEYRWVWIALDVNVDGALLVKVPRARELCRPWYREESAEPGHAK